MCTTKRKVFVTRMLPTEVLNDLAGYFDCQWWQEADVPIPRDVLVQAVEDAEGMITMLTDRIDENILNAGRRLKVVSNLAVGFDNIDIEAARNHGVVVCNTPDVLTESTADLTFALILATARRVVEAAGYIKEGRWKSWAPMLLAGTDVYNKTLGIIGLGRIGLAVAKRARGFGMRVMYSSPRRKFSEEGILGIEYCSLDQLLTHSDFVTLHAPLNSSTKLLLGRKELSLMKKSAILINTSRGGLIDELALVEALKTKQLGGAGLDVFCAEPVSIDHPLLQLPNVVALPHIGSATVETRTAMARLAADNLISVLTGREPKCRVV